jgi:GNAT superfamily N-acetyltransferase
MIGQTFMVTILEEKDIKALTTLLYFWIRDGSKKEQTKDHLEEIADVMHRMHQSIKNNDYTYLVARDLNNRAVGVMGIRHPEDRMVKYALTKNPAELINVFTDPLLQGQGIGRMLIEAIFIKAKDLGFTELILNSGPRYKNSAWGFYNKIFGEPITISKNYYGKNADAPIWRKIIGN